MPPTSTLFSQLGISLVLGLLVGLQREWTEQRMAGLRTFPLISVLGTVSAILAVQFGGWIVAAGLLSVVAVLVVTKWFQLTQPDATLPKKGLDSISYLGDDLRLRLAAMVADLPLVDYATVPTNQGHHNLGATQIDPAGVSG